MFMQEPVPHYFPPLPIYDTTQLLYSLKNRICTYHIPAPPEQSLTFLNHHCLHYFSLSPPTPFSDFSHLLYSIPNNSLICCPSHCPAIPTIRTHPSIRTYCISPISVLFLNFAHTLFLFYNFSHCNITHFISPPSTDISHHLHFHPCKSLTLIFTCLLPLTPL